MKKNENEGRKTEVSFRNKKGRSKLVKVRGLKEKWQKFALTVMLKNLAFAMMM